VVLRGCHCSCLDPYNQDVVRFFHGDGPAQQVEAGSKMGGTYPCVGCTARCSMFDDVAYSFRAKKHSIADRQTFVIEGKASESRRSA